MALGEKGRPVSDILFSREELLSGELFRSRRAARLLSAIEARCLHMCNESRRVVAAYLLEGDEDFRRRFEVDYIESLKRTGAPAEGLGLDHLERFAAQWSPLAPADPDLQARILRLIGQKYGLGPSTLAALGGAEREVQAAYRELFDESLDNLCSSSAGGLPTGPAHSPISEPDGHPRTSANFSTCTSYRSSASAQLHSSSAYCDTTAAAIAYTHSPSSHFNTSPVY